jgi:hypothetical protein
VRFPILNAQCLYKLQLYQESTLLYLQVLESRMDLDDIQEVYVNTLNNAILS